MMTSELTKIPFTIPRLPLWRGVQYEPTVEAFPFELSWDPNGFIRQTTDSEILKPIYTAYSAKDYSFISPPPGSSAWGDALANLYLDELLSHVECLDNKKILEIGAGTTGFAQLLMQRFKISSYTIVDPSINDETNVIRIIRQFFPCEEVLKHSYDLIISLNTIEHVADVSLFLSAIQSILKNNSAIAFVSLPDAGAQMFAGDLSVLLHEHINYFFVETFERYLTVNGLSARSVSVKNDSIFASVISHKTDDKKDNSVMAMSPLFPKGVNRMTKVLDNFGYVLDRFVKKKTIVFHGATPGLNSFLFLAGLGNTPTINITDGDKEKHGRFLPAHNKPIIAPSASLYERADLIVISAPSFYKQIKTYIDGAIKKSPPVIPLSIQGLTAIQEL